MAAGKQMNRDRVFKPIPREPVTPPTFFNN